MKPGKDMRFIMNIFLLGYLPIQLFRYYNCNYTGNTWHYIIVFLWTRGSWPPDHLTALCPKFWSPSQPPRGLIVLMGHFSALRTTHASPTIKRKGSTKFTLRPKNFTFMSPMVFFFNLAIQTTLLGTISHILLPSRHIFELMSFPFPFGGNMWSFPGG